MTGSGAAVRPGPDTAYVLDESGLVALARVPEGPPFVLEGSAALIWTEIVRGGTVAEVTGRVAVRVERPPDEIAPDVAAFVEELLAQGLLVPA